MTTAPVAPALKDLSILLVDDRRDSLNPLARLLRLDGRTVREAGTVTEAFRLAVMDPPDVLVTDLDLTDGDGCELLRRIRALHPAVRGIAVTGHTGEPHAAQCRAAGFESVLTKPVGFEQILDAIAGTNSPPPFES